MIKSLAFFIVLSSALTATASGETSGECCDVSKTQERRVNCRTTTGLLTGKLSVQPNDGLQSAYGTLVMQDRGISYDIPVFGQYNNSLGSEFVDLADTSEGSNIFNIHINFSSRAKSYIEYTNMAPTELICN